MQIALAVLLALALVVAAAALIVGLLVRERLRELLLEVRSARREVRGITGQIGAAVVNIVDGRPPLGEGRDHPDPEQAESATPLPPRRSTVQNRADEEPTQAYGAVRPPSAPADRA